MEYEELVVFECFDLIYILDGKFFLSVVNSMNFFVSCFEKDIWVGKNYIFFNILDFICFWGYDELCNLDWLVVN